MDRIARCVAKRFRGLRERDLRLGTSLQRDVRLFVDSELRVASDFDAGLDPDALAPPE